MKRVRLTSDALNSYGLRVLTSGIDISQYERNPVLLWMHERGTVIGNVSDLRVGQGEITGSLIFDEATDLSRQAKKQWEFGSLRMVSVGLDILELSTDPTDMVAGQTGPTITRSRLFEVSLVDIGANPDAIVLRHEGKTLNLADGLTLPEVLRKASETHSEPNPNNKPTTNMTKNIALALGLAEDATEAQILEKITKQKADLTAARFEADSREDQLITLALDAAIADGRIAAEAKADMTNIGATLGYEGFTKMLASLRKADAKTESTTTENRRADEDKKTYTPLPSDYKNGSETADRATLAAKWDSLDRQDGALLTLKRQNPDEFQRLFDAKFGKH